MFRKCNSLAYFAARNRRGGVHAFNIRYYIALTTNRWNFTTKQINISTCLWKERSRYCGFGKSVLKHPQIL